MLLTFIRIYPASEKAGAVIDLLSSMQAPFGVLAGAVDCQVLSETYPEGAICYLERWHSRDALDAHLRSPLFSRVLEALELSECEPTVEFYEMKRVGGMECIEAARRSRV